MSDEDKEKVEALIRAMVFMEDEQRLEVFAALGERYCRYCGVAQKPGERCQCWNDE